MQPQTVEDYKKLLTDVIKKQVIVLGPNITLAKARNVKELIITDDGTVTQINGDPQVVTQQLVNQFMELSGLIVKKTMEPLLTIHPEVQQQAVQPASQPASQVQNEAQTENKTGI